MEGSLFAHLAQHPFVVALCLGASFLLAGVVWVHTVNCKRSREKIYGSLEKLNTTTSRIEGALNASNRQDLIDALKAAGTQD